MDALREKQRSVRAAVATGLRRQSREVRERSEPEWHYRFVRGWTYSPHNRIGNIVALGCSSAGTADDDARGA